MTCALCSARIYSMNKPSGKVYWAHATGTPPQDHEATPRAPSDEEQERIDRERFMEMGHVHDGSYADAGCLWCQEPLHDAFVRRTFRSGDLTPADGEAL